MIRPNQIRAARALLGWKQADLAERAGISAAALIAIERGKSDPKFSTMETIERVLREGGVVVGADGGLRREPVPAET